jgi:ferredoxin-thioredoxin reductase catalytic subunit/predicted Zn-ribbon and HTH transcriptional regulator
LITLDKVRQRAESDAKAHGYYLNPDPEFLNDLVDGLKRNEERYGYPSCPCRLASGNFELDRDIICPCDYRDPDVAEYGSCYCALYVRKDLFEGRAPIKSIPERRPPEKQIKAEEGTSAASVEKAGLTATTVSKEEVLKIGRKMWYCRQCGYVCFRDEPPYLCPICKAKRELFAEIMAHTRLSG